MTRSANGVRRLTPGASASRTVASGVIAITLAVSTVFGQQNSTRREATVPDIRAAAAAAAARDSTHKTDRWTLSDEIRARWPVPGPEPLAGAILPSHRIVAFYGNPLSARMGILGEIAPEKMLARLDAEIARWRAADPALPIQPALHLVTVVAQGSPGRDGKYRLRMTDSLVEQVYAWAVKHDAILFLDVQVGRSTLREELPRLTQFLQRPNVHLGIDPEFSMKDAVVPGSKIGTMDAADVNYASAFLAGLVTTYSLPPKVLVVHRFTRKMLTQSSAVRLDPRVQVVVNMDGWGEPWLKKDSYRDYVAKEPVQFTGFKLFFGNDTKKGHAMMTPKEILQLFPAPLYIQYQ